ncbi:glycosyltransferase family 2 protein [Escherichia albertii]|uniref:Predicted glycosyltransferase family A n=1 Tax=Escherichia albertii TaxID=208962 RepID=A0A5A4U9B9_ESCAL|nr:glycosyltransferase family A protein [Escherichia albertii]QSZ84896.1 glycosyltransferase family 2 protein [Escherichia albertii]QSZ89277.1 glycosyltransferase family 2 protein [Escherichia albertii]QSZ93664.1 glycosyltransferase family 2 protein [Escherichia albertii]QSZ97464.1 glycosyltransferase family 2 protein [Escherichia albertii]QTA02446.1 glycosyltransferase family 2 protein [Escherichia albertii]
MENIQILMATMFKEHISDIDWAYKNINAPVLLINQSDFVGKEISDNITMISCTERGSSKSRNMAIDNATGDICVIADDDVMYVDNVESILRKAFADNPDADIITFQIMTPDGSLFNSGYPKNKQWHNWRSILRCASIEIAFRRNVIIKNKLRVDDNFGLGSKYRVHDEIIFLKDAMDKGLKILYIPIPIVIHPKESSGSDFNDSLVLSKGAAFIRLFGIKGILLNLIFAIKKHKEYRLNYNIIDFTILMFKGAFKFIREDMRNIK